MKKKKVWLAVLVIAVVICAVGVLLWFLLSGSNKSSKDILTDSIKHNFGLTKITKSDTDYEKFIKENIINATVSAKINVDDEIATGQLDFYGGKEQLYLLGELKEGNEKFALEGLLKEKRIYFTLKDKLSKYYYVDLDEILKEVQTELENLEGLNIDFEKITKYIEESIEEVITEDKIEVESATKTINGKEYKTKKYSYTITGLDVYNMASSFIKKVKADKELYKQLVDVLEKTEYKNANIDEMFDAVLDEIAVVKEYGKLLTYKAHIYNDVAISSEITVYIQEQNQSIPLLFVINNIDGFYEAYLSVMGQRIINFEAKETSTDNYDLSVSAQGQKLVVGTFKGNEDKFSLELRNTEALGEEFKVTADAEIKDEFTTKANIKFEFARELDGELTIETKVVDSIPSVDVSNSAPYKEMTEEDKKVLEEFGLDDVNLESSEDMLEGMF
ncbi:MAG: hypothetical protein IJ568_07155 [Bacilli bacterium]|nr:hypothetical protein [Bacilli bacterium]